MKTTEKRTTTGPVSDQDWRIFFCVTSLCCVVGYPVHSRVNDKSLVFFGGSPCTHSNGLVTLAFLRPLPGVHPRNPSDHTAHPTAQRTNGAGRWFKGQNAVEDEVFVVRNPTPESLPADVVVFLSDNCFLGWPFVCYFLQLFDQLTPLSHMPISFGQPLVDANVASCASPIWSGPDLRYRWGAQGVIRVSRRSGIWLQDVICVCVNIKNYTCWSFGLAATSSFH